MRTHSKRRFTLNMEPLEGRNAPSGGLASGMHSLADARREHAGARHAHVQKTQLQRASDDNLPRHSGLDDGPNHNAGDDNNRNRHGGR
jgi:hypothetical protein